MSGVDTVWCEGCFVRTVLGVQNYLCQKRLVSQVWCTRCLISRVAWCHRRRASGEGIWRQRCLASKKVFGVERVWCRTRLVSKAACVKHGSAFTSKRFLI